MILDIIEKKKNNQVLTKEEIEYVVLEYLAGNIKDYKMSSLLMAIVINGMCDEEIVFLTDAMLKSGDIIDLSMIKGKFVDKHSTGGVGDKTSLILAPLVASCGLKMAKMSGRGLGHTGGTIDKLMAIKGFKTDLTNKEFIKQVDDIGVAIISQTSNIVPADKKIYALRDVTGTVDSLALIASSIMSKKIASGASNILIDVKVGQGALIKNIKEARKLSDILIMLGSHYNKQTICFITNMDEPLGYSVGNGLEVIESINTLKGKGPKDLTDLVVSLATSLVMMGKKIDKNEAFDLVNNNLYNGKAFLKFQQMIKAQGGNLENISVSDQIVSIKSIKTGIVAGINTKKIGELVRLMGAGRLLKDDVISYGVGVVLAKKVGDFVLLDEELLKVYIGDKDVAVNDLLTCFTILPCLDKRNPLIYEIVGEY
ncbi:MAG: thymidine phosphorylase [Bacilli bacterium]